MSCTFAHNTNLSLISWLLESLETELSAFHQRNFLFFFFFFLRRLSAMRYIAWHIKGSGNICVSARSSGVGPCKWNLLAARPCCGWVTDCGAKWPKHTFSPQITPELFFLNDWPLPPPLLTHCLYKIRRNPSEKPSSAVVRDRKLVF